MRWQAKLSVVLALATLCAPPLAAQGEAQDEMRNEGVRLGEIVRSALEALTPAVGPLLDAVWPERTKKASREQLEGELEAKLGELRAAAASRLGRVEKVAAELELVLEFLAPSVNAQESAVRMSAWLGGELDEERWQLVDAELAVLEAFLGEVSGIDDDAIDRVDSIFLRERLSLIRQANLDTGVRLRQAIDRRSVAESQTQLSELQRRLQGVANAAGFLMANLESDLRAMAAWAADEASEKTPRGLDRRPTPAEEEFARRLAGFGEER